MPNVGSQVILCDLPVRFDTYKGCAHGCAYCFARRNNDEIHLIKPLESANTLRRFVYGHRADETAWIDWNIPIHWGGMSDPFQPIEKQFRVSYECLKVFAESQYPVVFSTKGSIAADPEYLAIIRECNAAGQVSIVHERYDRLEPGAPTFMERVKIMEALVPNTIRVIARLSPYVPGHVEDTLRYLKIFREAGIYGVEIEAMKRGVKAAGLVKLGADYVFPVEILRREFEQIKDRAHELGLKFYCGENRLRSMSDHRTCCGVGDIPGWKANNANLNSLVFNEPIKYTELMEQPFTARPFVTLVQQAGTYPIIKKSSYKQFMNLHAKSASVRISMGLDPDWHKDPNVPNDTD